MVFRGSESTSGRETLPREAARFIPAPRFVLRTQNRESVRVGGVRGGGGGALAGGGGGRRGETTCGGRLERLETENE